MTNQPEKNVPGPDTSTRLAYERTWLAHERTLMAWVRTATTLITFGFGVYSFFEFQMKGAEHIEPLMSPREVGRFMVGCGLISLVLGVVQNVMCLRQMRKQWPDAPRSVAAMLAGLIAILGLAIFITAIFRQ